MRLICSACHWQRWRQTVRFVVMRLPAPVFAHSRPKFVAQFTACSDAMVFRQNGIGPAHAITPDDQRKLLAVHGRYWTANVWLMRLYLVLLVAVPLANLTFASGEGQRLFGSPMRYVWLMPIIYLTVLGYLGRHGLRRLLVDLPVVAPALDDTAAHAVLLRQQSAIVLVLSPAVMAILWATYRTDAGLFVGFNALWTIGFCGVTAVCVVLGGQKYRLWAQDRVATPA